MKKNQNSKINILGIIILIIFLPLLLVNTTLIVKSYMHPDQAPDIFGYKPFIVLSGSMEPTIMTGDIVIIKECNAQDLKKGDVIAFRSGSSVITHRIIDIQKENGQKLFVTKGDNNNTEDRNLVSPGSVEGIYIGRIAKLGNFAMFLQTTLGAVIFISIPFILFMITDVAQRRKDNKLQREKQEQLERELQELKKDKKE